MPGAAEHVANLVANELLHLGTAWSKVLAGIEFLWAIDERLAHACRHRQTQVRVDVHLRATDPACCLNVRLGHAGGVFAQAASIFVDLAAQVLRHAGRPVQHQRIVAQARIEQSLLDGLQPVEVQVLLAFEFVRPVGVANRHGE